MTTTARAWASLAMATCSSYGHPPPIHWRAFAPERPTFTGTHENAHRPHTLAETTRKRGVPAEEVIAEIEAALVQRRARQGEGK